MDKGGYQNVFKQFAESADFGVSILNLDGRVNYINPYLCRILEASAEGFLEDDFIPLYSAEVHSKLLNEVIPEVLAKGIWEGQLSLLSQNNKLFNTSEKFTLIKDELGNPLFITIVIKIIEENSFDEYSNIIINDNIDINFKHFAKHLPIPLCLVNSTNGNILFCNLSFTELFGYDINNLQTIDDWWMRAYPDPKYRDSVKKIWQKEIDKAHKNNGKIASEIFDVTCLDGSIMKISIGAIILGDAILTTLNDVTEKENILQKFNLAAEAAHFGIWDWKVPTEEVFYSDIWKQQVGYEPDELENNFATWSNLLHPEDSDKMHQAVSDYLANPEGKFEHEFRLRHKDGSYRWIRNLANVYKDVEGNITLMTGIHIDITAAKEAEKTRHEQQEQLQSMFDGIDDIIYVADLDTYEMIYLNSAGKKICGDDYENQKCYTLLQGRDEPCPYCTNKQILENPGEALTWEFKNEITNEWFRCFDKAIRWHDGRLVRFEQASDISEIKKIHNALINEKEMTEGILNSIPGVFYQIDLAGNFIRVNTHFKELLGKSDDEIQQINLLDLFDDEDSSKMQAALVRASEEGSAVVEAYLNTQEGKVPFYFTCVQQTFDLNKCIIGVGSNIVKIKQVERELINSNEELLNSNEQLERFAYIASHDLQEPLRKIKSFSDLMAYHMKDKLDEKSKKYMNYVTSGTMRMQQLINDLLQFSRIETRGKPFKITNLSSVVDKAQYHLTHYIKDSKAQISVDEMPHLKVDSNQLITVFQSLIGNAIKFCDKDYPVINISAHCVEDIWQFSVSDNGMGMEEKYSDRIFNLFQRLHSKSEYSGTGIGLSLSQKIIERHKGKIWFTSILGEGSIFYFTISNSL